MAALTPQRVFRALRTGGLTFVLAALCCTVCAAETKRFSAVRDFQLVKDPTFVGYYVETKSADPAEHGVAIQTLRHRERPAAAELIYSGPGGVFDLVLQAVAEEDGESVYELLVGDRKLGERRNVPQSGKRTQVSHHWKKIPLEPGARLRVIFAGRTNGKIPEGDGTAWSRGRWRGLIIQDPQP